MIYPSIDGGFVISSGGTWLPGVYEDRRAANFAFRLSSEKLEHLRRRVVLEQKRLITWDDIKAVRS